MKEIVKIWFEKLYKEKIEDVEAAISNEKLWLKDAKDEDEAEIYVQNIVKLKEYLGLLKEKLQEVEKNRARRIKEVIYYG